MSIVTLGYGDETANIPPPTNQIIQHAAQVDALPADRPTFKEHRHMGFKEHRHSTFKGTRRR